MVEAAELLGIKLEDLEVATDVQGEAETEVSDDNLECKLNISMPSPRKLNERKVHVDLNDFVKAESQTKDTNKVKSIADDGFVVSQLEPSEDIPEKKLHSIGEKMIDIRTGTFNCDQCEYTTSNVKIGYRHVLTRHRGKTFQCKMCDYKSKSKGHLNGHMAAAHLGLRYDCDECDFQSAHKKNVKGHKQAKHNDGIKPYACDFCSFRAATEMSIYQHKKHNNHISQHITCTFCPFKSLTERGVKAHINKKHGSNTFK